ncbi:MAG: argininosuccinate lyase [Aggregatilineales bacterium]
MPGHESHREFSDWSLFEADLHATSAYAAALRAAGVLSDAEGDQIATALRQVNSDEQSGALNDKTGDDPFTTLDARLDELLGPLAGKLQVGRSRPERLLTALRVWLIDEIEGLGESLADLQRAVLQQAEGNVGALMPAYVHYQPAQVIAAGHWLLAYFWMLARDQERLTDCVGRASQSPLGSGLLTGTPHHIDRHALAQAIGLTDISSNSLDATNDWDFAVEFLSSASLIGVHLGRLSEDLFWFSSPALRFVSFDTADPTATATLGQARTAGGAMTGELMAALTGLKGLSSAYHPEAAETRNRLYAAVGTLAALLPALTTVVETLTLHPDRMWDALDESILLSDLADYLVARGVGYPEAQQIAGRVAQRAEEAGSALSDVALSDFQAESPAFDADVYAVLDFSQSAGQRSAAGGTAPAAIRAQIRQANAWLMDAGFE